MRSDLIYSAVATVPNRYMLCQLASKATRRFHRPNTRVQETMNEVLERFSELGESEKVGTREVVVAEAQRRAA